MKKLASSKDQLAAGKKRYWLFKSEPTAYSIDDLSRDKKTYWDGIRNYQARNMLRDEVKIGDRAFFYHSNAEPMAIVGIMEVIKNSYPDHSAFDKNDACHYDPKSDPENPTWMMVDVKFIEKFKTPVTREMLRENEITQDMMVMKKGSRLSILPVTKDEWDVVVSMANQ